MKKYYIVYRTVNLLTQQYYIGVHHQVKDDNYLGSGLRIKAQIKKYGKENFKRFTLFQFATEVEAFNQEVEILKALIKDPLCLNISSGGDGGPNFKGKSHSDETKAKLAALTADRVVTLKTREKLSSANKNRSPELKAQIAKALKENYAARTSIMKSEVSAKLSASHVPRSHSESTKEKLRQRALERFQDPEERAKVGQKRSSK